MVVCMYVCMNVWPSIGDSVTVWFPYLVIEPACFSLHNGRSLEVVDVDVDVDVKEKKAEHARSLDGAKKALLLIILRINECMDMQPGFLYDMHGGGRDKF